MNRLPAQKNKPKQTQFKPCPEKAKALSAAEGVVEWANFTTLYLAQKFGFPDKVSAKKSRK